MIKTYRISNMDAIINSVKGASTKAAPKAAAPKEEAAHEVKEEIQEEIKTEDKEEVKTEKEPVEESPVVKSTRKKSNSK